MEAVDADTDNKMSNKRKAVDEPARNEEEEEMEPRAKRPRCRRRSRSEPRNTGSDNSQKNEALRRLFGWYFLRDGVPYEGDDDNYMSDNDENDDPCYVEDPLLLDSVPECMDPEQLGFLLCAQETLRYLRQSGMSVRHNVYMSLRSRFVKAIKDLGIA